MSADETLWGEAVNCITVEKHLRKTNLSSPNLIFLETPSVYEHLHGSSSPEKKKPLGSVETPEVFAPRIVIKDSIARQADPNPHDSYFNRTIFFV